VTLYPLSILNQLTELKFGITVRIQWFILKPYYLFFVLLLSGYEFYSEEAVPYFRWW